MICFTIALRSKNSTKQWNSVLQDFNNTLHSIFQQSCDEFRVYVGCNEIPELFEEYDSRLTFVTVDLPIPQKWEECCRDRSWKLLMCAQKIKQDFFLDNTLPYKGTGLFIFPVDADDFISRRIADWCCQHPDANGFKSSTGYRWVKGSRYAEITPYYGGTMNIMKMYADDLPDELPDKVNCFDEATAKALTARYPIRWTDCEVADKFAALGKPLSKLPFRSTVYVLGTGANISTNDPHHAVSSKRFHPVAFLRKINPFTKRLLTASFKEEFGMR